MGLEVVGESNGLRNGRIGIEMGIERRRDGMERRSRVEGLEMRRGLG